MSKLSEQYLKLTLEDYSQLVKALIDMEGWFNLPSVRQAMIKDGYQADYHRVKQETRVALAKLERT